MNWFLSTLVYKLVWQHQPAKFELHEQLRLVNAGCKQEALEKARSFGRQEEAVLSNAGQEEIRWEFVGVSELHDLQGLTDGQEVYTLTREADEAVSFLDYANRKVDYLQKSLTLEALS